MYIYFRVAHAKCYCNPSFICFKDLLLAMSKREERERTESSLQRQHQDAVNKSIDETKDHVNRAMDEVKREAPRYSQTITDFHNETTDAMREITVTFLDSQKEVINSMQTMWTPFAERTGASSSDSTGTTSNNYGMMGMMQPWGWWWMGISPRDVANIYVRSISAMTDLVTANTRMLTNMMFAGLEASRATTNYARYTSKEIAKVTSHTVRSFGQNTRETIGRMQEANYGGTTTTGRTTAATT
jgi:hypothetical protein